jgi:hypothetical protein
VAASHHRRRPRREIWFSTATDAGVDVAKSYLASN